jgi:AcrR family transcriptional regulator
MARRIRAEQRVVKRNEILDAAQRLVYSKGYQEMTIQDILDALQISKGAFYHYFDSKPALLEALIERIWQETKQVISPIVQDPQLPALEKMHRFFDTVARWKTARKAYLLALLQIWYTDENAIVRQKVQSAMFKRAAPLLAQVIRQGLCEGVFSTPYPEQAGEIALSLLLGMGETYAEILLAGEPTAEDLPHAARVVAAYSRALERILDAPTGSLELMDAETLQAWFGLPRD